MKTRLSLSALALACATLAGCQNLPQGDLMQHGMMAVKAATPVTAVSAPVASPTSGPAQGSWRAGRCSGIAARPSSA